MDLATQLIRPNFLQAHFHGRSFRLKDTHHERIFDTMLIDLSDLRLVKERVFFYANHWLPNIVVVYCVLGANRVMEQMD